MSDVRAVAKDDGLLKGRKRGRTPDSNSESQRVAARLFQDTGLATTDQEFDEHLKHRIRQLARDPSPCQEARGAGNGQISWQIGSWYSIAATEGWYIPTSPAIHSLAVFHCP